MSSPPASPHTQLPWEPRVSTAGTGRRLSVYYCPISGHPWATPGSGLAVLSTVLTTELDKTGGYSEEVPGVLRESGVGPLPPRAGGSRSERVGGLGVRGP